MLAQGNIAGNWDVTLTSPLGTNTMEVAFAQDGEKVSGLLRSQMGELPFDGGTLSGSDLTFRFTVRLLGQPVEVALTGKVNGATIAGKAQVGGLGEGEWTAKRSVGTSTTTTSTSTTSTTSTTTTRTSTGTTTGFGVAGTWDVVLQTPGGDMPATATLRDEGGTLSGTFAGRMGETPVTGSVDGKAVKLSMTIQTPQAALNIVLTGDLDGDSIVNGKAEIAGMGQMEWSAKRAKQ